MLNFTKSVVASRVAKKQILEISLADRIFNEMLTARLKAIGSSLNFEYTEKNVPENGLQIYKMYVLALDGIEKFRVFSGANLAKDLFFTPETNLKYRAIHDVDHAQNYKSGQGTTKVKDELFLNCLMSKNAYDYAIAQNYTQGQALMTFFAIYADTVGQVDYYVKYKDFCSDQKKNTTDLLNDCEGIAALKNGSLSLALGIMKQRLNSCGISTNKAA